MKKRSTLFILFLAALFFTSCRSTLLEYSTNERADQIRRMPRAEFSYGKSARHKIIQATHCQCAQPEKAIVLFLQAAHDLAPYSSEGTWAKKASSYALASAVELIHENQYWGTTLTYKSYAFRILLDEKSLPASAFKTLQSTYQFYSTALEPEIDVRGTGSPLIANYAWNAERKTKIPWLPKIGFDYSITALADWTQQNTVTISLQDSRLNPAFSQNQTVPFAKSYIKTRKFILEGIKTVLRPESGIKQTGLYCFEPVDVNRIPVILVHGLAATPNLWVKPTHKIIHDPTVRANYQFYAFYYPTGLPLSLNAAELKKEIKSLYQYLKKNGAGSQAENMVVIGHSMGGILSSAISRDYRGADKEIYKNGTDSLRVDSMGKAAIEELLIKPPLDCVTRVIFVATPHRGSEYADNWIGQVTSHFIKIPRNAIAMDPTHYREDLTHFGRSLFRIDDHMDGVQRLRFNNPVLNYNLSRPKLPHVTYHSIIGDRGFPGDPENSTDGIVKYASSHLDEAASEKVVPAWHNAQDNDQAIEEMQRILRLHLKN